MSQHNSHNPRLRARLAQEAARIISETGVRDFAFAKRKAAASLRSDNNRDLPSNQEIEEALVDYQQLFCSDSQPATLRHLRQQALEAMNLFSEFQPRLVGPVLAGSADENTPVALHLFADTPEQLDFFLMEQKIPYELGQRRLRSGAGGSSDYPVYRFIAGDTPVELTVFSIRDLRQAPLSPLDGRPMSRANRKAVQKLLETEPATGSTHNAG